MGGEVPRVPERAQVRRGGAVRPSPPGPSDGGPGFGPWYRTQRELRGVAAEYVSERTKLAPQRIAAIERDEARLRPDGQGRMTARALAEAIGADADEAIRVLVEFAEAAARPERRLARLSVRGVAAALALLLLAGGGWWAANRLLELRSPGAPVKIVNRPDYVQRALDGER